MNNYHIFVVLPVLVSYHNTVAKNHILKRQVLVKHFWLCQELIEWQSLSGLSVHYKVEVSLSREREREHAQSIRQAEPYILCLVLF